MWALLAPVILLGGMFSGLFTPTEAAAEQPAEAAPTEEAAATEEPAAAAGASLAAAGVGRHGDVARGADGRSRASRGGTDRQSYGDGDDDAAVPRLPRRDRYDRVVLGNELRLGHPPPLRSLQGVGPYRCGYRPHAQDTQGLRPYLAPRSAPADRLD